MITISWIELKESDAGILTRQPATIELPDASLVPQALAKLGYKPDQIVAMIAKRAVAVFGVYATAHTPLHNGDRLEILDSLHFNPMESRRRRAAHKAMVDGRKPPRKSQKRVGIDQHRDV